MPRFAANLSLMYNEHAFPERFAAAARDGFTAVEYLFPYAYPAATLTALLRDNGLRQVLFNAPPGDWDAGERGIACLPGRQAEFRDGLRRALDYAEALDCPQVHVMAGIMPAGVARDALAAVYLDNLRWAAAEAAARGRAILIEPINRRDFPGYFLERQADAHALAAETAAANLFVQMDLYHCQIVEGDLAMRLQHWLPTGRVAHLQIAGVPERHEPDSGEIHYPYLFDLIDRLGYAGWIGCEYRPRRGGEMGGTSAGLGWLRRARGDA